MAKVGRPRNFEKPEELLEYFYEYKSWCEANPVKKTVKGNKGWIISEEELRRPLTFDGFIVYCFENDIARNLKDYFNNKNNAYTEFSSVCDIIKTTIRNDQMVGGMIGIYKESITQRITGLVDKQETKHSFDSGAVINWGANEEDNKSNAQAD